jgi:hypothetical protein
MSNSFSQLGPESSAIQRETVTLRQTQQQEQAEIGWEKPEWTDLASGFKSSEALERLEALRMQNSKVDPAAILELEELELRHTEQEKKEYQWEKPEWAKKPILRSACNSIDDPASPTKAPIEWEKPVWAKNVVLRKTKREV